MTLLCTDLVQAFYSYQQLSSTFGEDKIRYMIINMVIMNMKEMLVEEKKLIMMKLVGVEEEEDGEEMEEEEEKMEEEEEDGEEMEGKEGESRHQGRFQKLFVCLVIEFLPLGFL